MRVDIALQTVTRYIWTGFQCTAARVTSTGITTRPVNFQNPCAVNHRCSLTGTRTVSRQPRGEHHSFGTLVEPLVPRILDSSKFHMSSSMRYAVLIHVYGAIRVSLRLTLYCGLDQRVHSRYSPILHSRTDCYAERLPTFAVYQGSPSRLAPFNRWQICSSR